MGLYGLGVCNLNPPWVMYSVLVACTRLRCRIGCHGPPNNLGHRTGISRRQRSYPRCDMLGVADECHLVSECLAI